LASFGHLSKFQRVSRLGFVTAPTSLNGSQPNFVRCLAVSLAGTLYIHFGGCCPLTEFCQVQNSLCVQVLRSHVSAVLLHSTRAVRASKTLRRGARNGITELSPLVVFISGRYLYSEGGHHVWPIGPHSSYGFLAADTLLELLALPLNGDLLILVSGQWVIHGGSHISLLHQV